MIIPFWQEELNKVSDGRIVTSHSVKQVMQDEIDALRSQLQKVLAMLSLTRAEASLMAGEMSAQEWRTVKAVLDSIKRRIESE